MATYPASAGQHERHETPCGGPEIPTAAAYLAASAETSLSISTATSPTLQPHPGENRPRNTMNQKGTRERT